MCLYQVGPVVVPNPRVSAFVPLPSSLFSSFFLLSAVAYLLFTLLVFLFLLCSHCLLLILNLGHFFSFEGRRPATLQGQGELFSGEPGNDVTIKCNTWGLLVTSTWGRSCKQRIRAVVRRLVGPPESSRSEEREKGVQNKFFFF